MIANLFDKNLVKVLSYLLISPGSRWRRKELKEKTGMNNIPLDSALNQLLALNILKEKKNLFELNFENRELINVIQHIKKEYLSFNVPYAIYNLLSEITTKLSKEKDVINAFLFGSYAKLIYTEKSDIDIAVILSNPVKNTKNLEKIILREMEKLEKKHQRKIELHFFNEKDLKAKDAIIQEIKKNGKQLF